MSQHCSSTSFLRNLALIGALSSSETKKIMLCDDFMAELYVDCTRSMDCAECINGAEHADSEEHRNSMKCGDSAEHGDGVE